MHNTYGVLSKLTTDLSSVFQSNVDYTPSEGDISGATTVHARTRGSNFDYAGTEPLDNRCGTSYMIFLLSLFRFLLLSVSRLVKSAAALGACLMTRRE